MGISLGLVGLGSFGHNFIEPFMKHPDVERFALCDMHKDRLENYAKKYGVAETYSSLDDICKSDIEALAIVTQHWLHAPQAIQALKAGKHVYSAVPTAYSMEQLDALVNTVKQTGRIYMLGETSYFFPSSVFCRKKAEEGAFGQFVHCRAEYFHDMSHGLYEVWHNRWGEQWAPEKAGDPPMYYPTHSICFPVSVMKAHMTEVSAQGYIYPNDDFFRMDTIYKNPFSNETALFKMSNGATALISEFRRIGHPGATRINGIYGTEGSYEDSLAGKVWGDKKGKQDVDLKPHREPLPEALKAHLGGHQGAEAYLVHEFVNSVNRHHLPRTNIWEAARYCAPGIVAHQSALEGGRVLRVPDWGDAPQ